MTHVVCPGSFDPPTNGHLDVISRAAQLFDTVTVAVLINPDKTGLFSISERLDLIRDATATWKNIQVDSFNGLLVEYCRNHNISGIVKGLRAISDFDSELQMAQMNSHLGDVDTIFIPTSADHAFISSSLIKQIAAYGGDISPFVSPQVASALQQKYEATN